MSIDARGKINPAAFVVAATALAAIGLVVLASASAGIDRPIIGFPLWDSPLIRQGAFLAVGMLVLLVTAYVGPFVLSSHAWRQRAAWGMFLLVLLALGAAMAPGLTDVHRGSQRWVKLGFAGLSFQPSEFAKPALILCLAAWFSRRGADPRSALRGFAPAAMLVGIVVAIVGKENLGTAGLLGVIGFSMMFVAGCHWMHLAAMIAFGLFGVVVLLMAEEYRLDRLTAYTRMWEERSSLGYQPLQSLVSIASGGWLGAGLGAGVQKYGYLPESRTDFIYSLLCEETGVLGGTVVIGLFLAILWAGGRVMWTAASRFERLLAFGLTAALCAQAAMNVAVVTVVTPTTGVSLPLISAGGSGTVSYCLMFGLLAALASRTRETDSREIGDGSPTLRSAATAS